MKSGAKKYILSSVLGAFCVVNSAEAFYGGVSPEIFNKMYYVASLGKVGVLQNAVNRGLNVDAVNPNGDTGLCIAIKRKNHVAYNTFKMVGANTQHPCTYRISREYQEFLGADESTTQAVGTTANDKEYLYYNGEDESSWWPWILGGALVGGGIYWYTDHHHKSHSSGGGGGETPVMPEENGYGLAVYVDKYIKLINSGTVDNSENINGSNPKAAEVVDKIKLLPNVLSNYQYLQTYAKVTNGATFNNLSGSSIFLGDAAIAMSSQGANSKIINKGRVGIEARNGAIGMVASNSASAVNGVQNGTGGADDNTIRMIFKGSQEGDTIMGMYADTHSAITNYGNIVGVSSLADTPAETSSVTDAINLAVSGLSDIVYGGNLGENEDVVVSPNSGSILGMSLFDFYTGTDLSRYTVSAKNYGNIILQAGNNNATSAAISLIGMGSYLDDRFLNGINNPAFAEKMLLENYGNINLAYQKTYNLSSEALKLGTGGVIGIRADASTDALNRGAIDIDLQATTINTDSDVAAGMLSLHGAKLINGTVGSVYNGQGTNTGGTIRMRNEATSGGVFYGMLAAKGSGTQTGLYKWREPSLHNYGLIDMQVSNSYAMASFAGGEMINDGVINLGVENGQSYYKNDKGLYAAGEDITEQVSLVNNGIINVFAEESFAIYNAFSGSVTQTNTGSVYLSNKATNSKVFGGNFSTAVNTGSILYKVGNSNSFTFPGGRQDDIGLNVKVTPVASVIVSSGEDSTTKQYVVNDSSGTITIGAARNSEVDYGGTFGTAGIQVAKQGSARNKSTINLNLFDKDILQFNAAMWLSPSATAEAFAENYGTIVISSANSIGMRNDSGDGASATNFGTIYARGEYDYGMSTSASGNIFNGRFLETEGETKLIKVIGEGSIGMYIKDGHAWNYGTIELLGNHTTAFQLDGSDAQVLATGNIEFTYGLDDITWFWMTNGASETFDYNPITIDGFILGKATTDESGGQAYFSKSSVAYVKGEKSHLFVADGSNSGVYNRGIVEVSEGAKAMVARNGGSAYNEMRSAEMTIKDASSIGIFAEDEKSIAGTAAGSNIYVQAGEGLHAEGLASVDNNGNITVTNGIGIHLLDGNVQTYTNGISGGNITVEGSGAIGAKVVDGAHFSNSGKINVKNGGVGIDTDSIVTNDSSGSIVVEANGIGINASSDIKNIINKGEIDVKGANARGVVGSVTNNGAMYVSSANAYAVDGNVINNGYIEVLNGIGVNGSATNYATISVLRGKGIVGDVINSGTINVESGVGIYGSGSNSGSIVTKGDAGVQVTGIFKNSESISGNGIGADVLSGGTFTNQGTMTMTDGTAIKVGNGAYALNSGTITINNGYGFYVENGGIGTNTGTISLENSGYGAYVESGGSFTNSGTIMYHSKANGKCANIGVGGKCLDEDEEDADNETSAVDTPIVIAEAGATFINNGVLDLGDASINFDDGGDYIVGAGGAYRAYSLSGNVIAGENIVKEGFADTYTVENALEGQNNGVTVHSESYLFEADLNDKGDASDVVLTRKSFNDLVEDQNLADFFEINYQAKNNEKMYQAIKSANNVNSFNAQVESESGKKFYANLPRENMAVLRGIQNQEQKRVLEDGLGHMTLSANYFRTGKDGIGSLSDYEDDVYSVTFGGGTRLNRNWSIGGELTAAYADSSYDKVNSERENKILMALMPIVYQNSRFKFLTTPSIGVGYGSYKRKTLDNEYEADTFDIYYGLYNHAEYNIDMRIAELVTEAELNLQGVSSDDAKEKGGFKMYAQDMTSLEAGIGVKLRKRIKLSNERELMLALGTKYYHEMLDPYKDIRVGTDAASYKLKGYDEDKNRLRTTAEAMYKEGDFRLSAEVAHNVEKENNIEGGVGVWYNF